MKKIKNIMLSVLTICAFVCSFNFPVKANEYEKNEIISIEPRAAVENVSFTHIHYFDTLKTKYVEVTITVQARPLGGTGNYLVSYTSGNCKISSKGGTARIVSDGYKNKSDGTLDVIIGVAYKPTGEIEKTYNMTFNISDKTLKSVVFI